MNYVGIVAHIVSSADALGLAEINCFNINLSLYCPSETSVAAYGRRAFAIIEHFCDRHERVMILGLIARSIPNDGPLAVVFLICGPILLMPECTHACAATTLMRFVLSA
jgi:hypothetical protein